MAGRLKVRDQLRQMLEEDQKREPTQWQHRLLERAEFDRLSDEVGGVSDKDALLDFLHHKWLGLQPTRTLSRPQAFSHAAADIGDKADGLSQLQSTNHSPVLILSWEAWFARMVLTPTGNSMAISIIEKFKTFGGGEPLLPRVYLVISLLKRWLLGTLQGSASDKYLDDYLNEFVFRFNGRRSASRGKLFYRLAQQAINAEPATYSMLTSRRI